MHRERNSQIKKRKQNAYKHYLTMIISGINKFLLLRFRSGQSLSGISLQSVIFNSTGGYMFKTNHLDHEFLISVTSFFIVRFLRGSEEISGQKTFYSNKFDIFLRMRFLYILFSIVYCDNSKCLYQKFNDETWQKICPTQKILSVCEGPSLLKIIA